VNRRWLGFLILLLAGVMAWLWWLEERREHLYDDMIRAAAQRHKLPPALVKAVVWRESGFDAAAVGRAGEIGLMQLMDFTAQEWADSQRLTNFVHEFMFDPRTNTLAGSYYLAKVLKRYPHTDNPFAYALADYNAGRSRVLKWMKGEAVTNSAAFLTQIDIPSTRHYVETTLERYDRYRARFQ